LVASVLASRLVLQPDAADLLPEAGQGAALRDYARVFGRREIASLLVRGADADRVRAATMEARTALNDADLVSAAVTGIQMSVPADPTLAWAWAGPRDRARLREAVEPDGMRERLADTRRLLLTPGAASLADTLRADPLRMRQIPAASDTWVAGAKPPPGHALAPDSAGAFVADQGRARLILLSVEGQALRGKDAKAVVASVQSALRPARETHPDVRFDLTGGHAIAADTERVMRRDMLWSGLLSVVLAAVAFALTFRRLRALVAVLPPLLVGTLWTSATAAVAFQQLSALTLGFLAVVVGVGLDTGIHVYAALMEARRAGRPPALAALQARADTARPTLIAAGTAAIAFGTLALSSVPALRQFGLLCAAGEMLTALAILALTPWIGSWLERGEPPPRRVPRWVPVLDRIRQHHAAPILLGFSVFVPVAALVSLGPPPLADSLVAIRPGNLPSVETQDAVDDLFGGGRRQWVVLIRDDDGARARARADRLFEALAAIPEAYASLDALARFAPGPDLQRARLKARDSLGLPSRAPDLRDALSDVGFDTSVFAPAISSFVHPSHDVRDPIAGTSDAHRLLRARYLAEEDGAEWAALYVRPRPETRAALEHRIRKADPGAVITGYARLESSLSASLRGDLPRVGWAAVLLVATVLVLTLRRGRDVLVALGVLGFEILWVAAIVRFLGLPLHLYNAFVLPVLLGITVDEVVFLLHRSRGGAREALEREGRNVLATGVTTAAGFFALMGCGFRGLRDMGVLGTWGVLAGLAAALWVVPVVVGRTGGPRA